MVLDEGFGFLMLCSLFIKMGRFVRGNRERLGKFEVGEYLLGPIVEFSM